MGVRRDQSNEKPGTSLHFVDSFLVTETSLMNIMLVKKCLLILFLFLFFLIKLSLKMDKKTEETALFCLRLIVNNSVSRKMYLQFSH